MNLPYELSLFGIAFFGFMAVVNIVQAHRKREKTYYLSGMISFVVLLAFVFAFLNQPILFLILMIGTGIFSIAGLPKLLKIQKRELVKQLQKADLSAPLRVREFFTSIAWFKLASKWGLGKTMFLFYLSSVVINGGIFLILMTFYSFITIGFVVIYATIFPIIFTFICYQQLKKASEKE